MEIEKLYQTQSEQQALEIKEYLEKNGIPTIIKNLHLRGMSASSKAYIRDIEIHVAVKDFSKAEAFLGQIQRNPPIERVPKALSEETLRRHWALLLTFTSFLVVTLPWNIRKLAQIFKTDRVFASICGLFGLFLASIPSYFCLTTDKWRVPFLWLLATSIALLLIDILTGKRLKLLLWIAVLLLSGSLYWVSPRIMIREYTGIEVESSLRTEENMTLFNPWNENPESPVVLQPSQGRTEVYDSYLGDAPFIIVSEEEFRIIQIEYFWFITQLNSRGKEIGNYGLLLEVKEEKLERYNNFIEDSLLHGSNFNSYFSITDCHVMEEDHLMRSLQNIAQEISSKAYRITVETEAGEIIPLQVIDSEKRVYPETAVDLTDYR